LVTAFGLEIQREDVADRVLQRVERHRAAVGRKVRRLGLVDGLHRDPLLDVARQHVLDDQRALFLGPDEVGEPIALGRPRHPRVGRLVDAHLHEVVEAEILVEAAGQVADDRSVLRRHEDDVELLILAIDRHDAIRSPEGDGAIDSASANFVFSLFGDRSRPVVGRPLLVAERLEAVLQVALEVLVELVLLHPQRFLVRVLAAADDALAQREQELADAFLAELRFDVFEHRVTEVVDQARRPAAPP
jgi:hypothetical protein